MELVRQFILLVPHMRESLKLLPALLYAPGKQIREDLGIVITVEERKKEGKRKGKKPNIPVFVGLGHRFGDFGSPWKV